MVPVQRPHARTIGTRVLAAADTGANGVGGIYKNAAREMKDDYSAPIFEEEMAIYWQAGKVFDYRSVDDLSGHRGPLHLR
jgi:hypothetical protein